MKYNLITWILDNIVACFFQFFITLGENIDYLDGQHTVFGEVSEGWETLDKLNEVFVDRENRPYKDVR